LNCLKRAGINKVGEVLEKNKPELLRIRNFGEKSYNELFGRLRVMNLLPPDMDPEQKEDASEGETESVVVGEAEPETVDQ
jgi:DNA-directed RNA polymerase alpha subunit